MVKNIFYMLEHLRRENLLTLIEAFKKLKDELRVNYKLVLAGSTYINGDNNVLLKIGKYIKKYNLLVIL